MIYNPSSIALYGNVWNTFQLKNSYILDEYSQFTFSLSQTDHIVGICLSETLEDVSHCFHLCSPRATSVWGGDLPHAYRYNLALGKSTSYSSFFSGGESRYAVDGDVNTAYESAIEEKPWWEVDLGGSYLIQDIIIHKNSRATIDNLTDFSLTIFDSEARIAFHHHYSAGTTDSYKRITAPFPLGSRVRVTLNPNGKSRILSIGEVEVFAAQDSPKQKIVVPIGKMRKGQVVNYISFIQEHSNNGVSLLEDLTFVYGSFEGIY